MDDQALRLWALGRAIELEGPKAVTSEVLEAAQWIDDFVTNTYSEPDEGELIEPDGEEDPARVVSMAARARRAH